MDRARRTPWIGIKAKALGVVKTGALVCLAGLAALGARAQATPTATTISVHDTDAFPPAVRDRDLPNIMARQFEVKSLRMSGSARAYLFEDPDEAQPSVGKILLLKKDGQPVMAFRVLRTLPLSKKFIAKRVRRYGNHEKLSEGSTFVAVERINEIPLPNTMGYSTEDEKDLAELDEDRPDLGVENPPTVADFFRSDQIPLPPETVAAAETPPAPPADAAKLDAPPETASSAEPEAPAPAELDDERSPAVEEALPETAEYDPDLDAGSSPESGTNLASDDEDDVYDPESAIDEVDPIDHNRHGLAGQFGFLRTNALNGTAVYYKAGGLRYGLTFAKQVLLSQARLQDDFTLEGGFFMYSIADYAEPEAGDAFKVNSLVGTLRYTIHTSETFGIFFYGGVMRNYATSTGLELDTNEDSITALSSIIPAAGGGMIFRMGPGWEIRADLGADMIAMGLMLRF